MIWKMYIFVRTKDKNDKRFSKGKLAGQVGHVCMRLGYHMPMTFDIYEEDGEIKLVFKMDRLPFASYHPLYKESNVKYYGYHKNELSRYSATVKDNTTGEYIALAVLTQEPIDTTAFKLL